MPAPNSPLPRMPITHHHRDHLQDGAALFGVERLREDEEEHQRHQVVEKDDHLLPEGQPDIDSDQCQISVSLSRSFFPVSSMKTSSSVGRSGARLRARGPGIDPLHDFDQRARGPCGGDGEPAPVVAQRRC